jgi:hypothetical protein
MPPYQSNLKRRHPVRWNFASNPHVTLRNGGPSTTPRRRRRTIRLDVSFCVGVPGPDPEHCNIRACPNDNEFRALSMRISGSWQGVGLEPALARVPPQLPRRHRRELRSYSALSRAYGRTAMPSPRPHPLRRLPAVGEYQDRIGSCPKQPTYRQISPSDKARSKIAAYSCVDFPCSARRAS